MSKLTRRSKGKKSPFKAAPVAAVAAGAAPAAGAAAGGAGAAGGAAAGGAAAGGGAAGGGATATGLNSATSASAAKSATKGGAEGSGGKFQNIMQKLKGGKKGGGNEVEITSHSDGDYGGGGNELPFTYKNSSAMPPLKMVELSNVDHNHDVKGMELSSMSNTLGGGGGKGKQKKQKKKEEKEIKQKSKELKQQGQVPNAELDDPNGGSNSIVTADPTSKNPGNNSILNSVEEATNASSSSSSNSGDQENSIDVGVDPKTGQGIKPNEVDPKEHDSNVGNRTYGGRLHRTNHNDGKGGGQGTIDKNQKKNMKNNFVYDKNNRPIFDDNGKPMTYDDIASGSTSSTAKVYKNNRRNRKKGRVGEAKGFKSPEYRHRGHFILNENRNYVDTRPESNTIDDDEQDDPVKPTNGGNNGGNTGGNTGGSTGGSTGGGTGGNSGHYDENDKAADAAFEELLKPNNDEVNNLKITSIKPNSNAQLNTSGNKKQNDNKVVVKDKTETDVKKDNKLQGVYTDIDKKTDNTLVTKGHEHYSVPQTSTMDGDLEVIHYGGNADGYYVKPADVEKAKAKGYDVRSGEEWSDGTIHHRVFKN